jgi:hypothetical protein
MNILNTQRHLHHTEPVQKYVQLLISSQYAGSSYDVLDVTCNVKLEATGNQKSPRKRQLLLSGRNVTSSSAVAVVSGK